MTARHERLPYLENQSISEPITTVRHTPLRRNAGVLPLQSGYALLTSHHPRVIILIDASSHLVCRAALWHQKIWHSHNITPDGGVGRELGAAQIKSKPADTRPPEAMARVLVEKIANDFETKFKVAVFGKTELDDSDWQKISRFAVNDDASLLRLAKEIHRVFGDRLNKKNLLLVAGPDVNRELGTLKLLEKLCANVIGESNARKVMSPMFGIYDLRIGDAHPTSSKIENAFELSRIDRDLSIHSQAHQLIFRFCEVLSSIEYCLFSAQGNDQDPSAKR